jgi:hypothetical protein
MHDVTEDCAFDQLDECIFRTCCVNQVPEWILKKRKFLCKIWSKVVTFWQKWIATFFVRAWRYSTKRMAFTRTSSDSWTVHCKTQLYMISTISLQPTSHTWLSYLPNFVHLPFELFWGIDTLSCSTSVGISKKNMNNVPQRTAHIKESSN